MVRHNDRRNVEPKYPDDTATPETTFQDGYERGVVAAMLSVMRVRDFLLLHQTTTGRSDVNIRKVVKLLDDAMAEELPTPAKPDAGEPQPFRERVDAPWNGHRAIETLRRMHAEESPALLVWECVPANIAADIVAAKPDAGEGLDVERLQKALIAAWPDRESDHVRVGCDHGMPAHNRRGCVDCRCLTPGFGISEIERDAANIAAAYLRATTDETGGGK